MEVLTNLVGLDQGWSTMKRPLVSFETEMIPLGQLFDLEGLTSEVVLPPRWADSRSARLVVARHACAA